MRRIVSAAAIVLLTSLSVPAQPSTPQADLSEAPQTASIVLSARNKDGSPAELSASDLHVKIDGKKTVVRDVHRLSAALHYCLVFDTSGSGRPRFESQQSEAIALLSKIPQAGRDHGTLAAFSDESYLDAEGSDPQELMKAISKERAHGGTALYDAMAACSSELLKAPADAPRVMFIFSDGDDNASHITRDAALRALARARVRAYSIGRAEGPKAVATLKQFSEVTGGKNYSPGAAKDLEATLADISADLAGIYSVSVTSAQPPSGYRFYKLEMKCTRKNISLTAPRHYFVPAP